MSKHDRPFIFKRFHVDHCRSSMKVGIDAVVLGTWAMLPENSMRVIDVGCGCGVISMIIAQRYPDVSVLGIDIDEDSIEECSHNFSACDWSDRLSAVEKDFLSVDGEFDYIISNPPYFEDGLKNIESARLRARHQGSLNPIILIKHGYSLLREKGRIGFVIPYGQLDRLLTKIEGVPVVLNRILLMAGKPGLEWKRCFLEFEKSVTGWNPNVTQADLASNSDRLYVEDCNGNYSEAYRALCKDFYLKF